MRGRNNHQYLSDRSKLSIGGAYGELHRFYSSEGKTCEICGTDKSIEMHHKDRNPRNNEESNIMFLCSKHHHLWHKQGSIGVFKDKVISIKYVGEEEVYDIAMQEPYNNFVANSIVVHNCQLSQRYTKVDPDQSWYVIPPEFQSNPEYADWFRGQMNMAIASYEGALAVGIKPEDARYLLPEATMTTVTMTMNVRELFHFLNLRTAHDAQWEIRDLAYLLADAIAEHDPQWAELVDMWIESANAKDRQDAKA